MDELLPKLLSFPPHPPPQTPLSEHAYDEGIKAQYNTLKNLLETKLLTQTSSGESVLDVINPALNTVPYAFILVAAFKALSKNTKGITLEDVWDKAVVFLNQFDARQIRYVGEQFTQIVEAVVNGARRSRQPSAAIPPLRDSILKLQPEGSLLTSSHLHLAQLTLESRAYSLPIEVLDRDILYFPGSSSGPKPKYLCDMTLPPTSYITPSTQLTQKLKNHEVLEYFLLTGMIFIGLRDWEKARIWLENAITYPLRGDSPTSRIMVEAYKKWILVGLLVEGKMPSLPRWTSNHAAKQFRTIAKPYEAVAQLFNTPNAARFKAEADAAMHVFRQDFNLGLIHNVLAAYQQFQIKNLGSIYTKISIPEIHDFTQSAETGTQLPTGQHVESLVQDMIANGALRATLSSDSPPILTFAANGPVLSEEEMQRELAAASQRITVLANEIKQTDKLLTHDKDYVKYYQKWAKKEKENAQGGSGDMMDWKDEDEEDLMAGAY